MEIKKGDNVKVLVGKNRGKTGKVLKIDRKHGLLTVEGVNVYKKHVRPKRAEEKGQMVDLVRPMPVSKVELVCPHCHKPTRVGMRMQGEIKSRFCKKCNAAI